MITRHLTALAALGVAPTAAGIGYRVTARAVGARPETVVILQSMYSTL